jgi:hypothetical protein
MSSGKSSASKVDVPKVTKEFMKQLDLEPCATCGYARMGDPLTVAAIYSVAIENPKVEDHLCRCSRG